MDTSARVPRVSPVADNSCFLECSTWISPAPANNNICNAVLSSHSHVIILTCISWIFSSSSGLMPSWPPITVSRSLLRLLFPVTETVTSTGLMATAAAAVRRAIPARGAISRARGLAWVWAAPLRSAAEMLRHYFLTRIAGCLQFTRVFVSIARAVTFCIHYHPKWWSSLGKPEILTNLSVIKRSLLVRSTYQSRSSCGPGGHRSNHNMRDGAWASTFGRK